MSNEKQQIDALIDAFFTAFDNTNGRNDLTVLYDMFLPEAIIVNNTGDQPAVYSPTSFVPPRQRMFDEGNLVDFKEWEMEAETTIFGSVAHRKTVYGKSGIVSGSKVDCKGHKSFQFVMTEQGWKITALSWWDEV
jgi:ribosomal-protein-serine acetyltransferase